METWSPCSATLASPGEDSGSRPAGGPSKSVRTRVPQVLRYVSPNPVTMNMERKCSHASRLERNVPTPEFFTTTSVSAPHARGSASAADASRGSPETTSDSYGGPRRGVRSSPAAVLLPPSSRESSSFRLALRVTLPAICFPSTPASSSSSSTSKFLSLPPLATARAVVSIAREIRVPAEVTMLRKIRYRKM
jgi:hypothetical protein